jgi:hypothetical protein
MKPYRSEFVSDFLFIEWDKMPLATQSGCIELNSYAFKLVGYCVWCRFEAVCFWRTGLSGDRRRHARNNESATCPPYDARPARFPHR